MNDLEEVKNWLLSDGNAFCAELTSHIFINSDGHLYTCCDGDKIGVKVENKSIKDLSESPAYYKMIDEMKSGIIPDACKICKNKKDPLSPRISNCLTPRNIEITKAAMAGDIQRTINSVHYRVGNKCNLKCRICWDGCSTSWAKDAYKLKNTDTPYKETDIFFRQREGQWPKQNEEWLSSKGLENIVSLHLSGGEPLYNDDTYKVVNSILSVNKNIEVKFNTNGTFKYDEKHLQTLLTAKIIKFDISIDDVGARFEYQRKNAIWKDVKENLKWFVELEKNNSNVIVNADLTVSIFNIYYLPEILEEFGDIGLKLRTYEEHPYDHYTRHNPHYYIRNLNDKQKEVIKNKLQKYVHIKAIRDIIEHMMIYEKTFSNEDRMKIISDLDKIRNEDFEEVFPEMYMILDLE